MNTLTSKNQGRWNRHKRPFVEATHKRLERVDLSDGRKIRILSFLNTYSHTAGIGVSEYDPSVLAETKAVLGELLEMIKSIDPTHYAGMEQLVNGKEASA